MVLSSSRRPGAGRILVDEYKPENLKESAITIGMLTTTGHCPESVTADFIFRVITHQAQRFVDRVFAHGFIRIMATGEYHLLMPGYFPYLFQNSDGLTGEGNDMRCAHFGTTPGIADTGDGFTGGWNCPDSVPEIDLRPTGKAQFAGTDE